MNMQTGLRIHMKKMMALSLVLILQFSQLVCYEYELAIGAIFRDEAPYLKEWIEFHKLVGCEHFYLYNNASTDNFYEIQESYIANGEVDLIDWNYVDDTHQGFCFTVQPKSTVL